MDYIDRDKKKKLKENLIKLLITLLVSLILILSYIVYESVQVSEKSLVENNVTVEKTTQTVKQVKEKTKRLPK